MEEKNYIPAQHCKRNPYLPALLWFALTGLLLARCAQPLAPTGGPRDEIPPQVVEEASTPNFQTNFQKQTIDLTFDEWVQLQDVFNQVVISPPLQYNHQVKLKRRTVQFIFDEKEELRPEATYTINFGDAVRDLSEKNPAEDLRFVFATGPFLDSLRLSGRVLDALTGKPVEKVLFMLYDNLADSVVRTERPFYFAKTNKEGEFTIENIKRGVFKGFALEDVGFNYRFDQPTEKIGFPEDLLAIDSNSQSLQVEVRLFTEAAPLQLQEIDTSSRYGLVKLSFNRQDKDLTINTLDLDLPPVYAFDRDTLLLWYEQASEQPWALVIRKDTVLNDTIRIQPGDRAAFLEKNPLRVDRGNVVKSTIRIPPGQLPRLVFSNPLLALDTNLVTLYVDTTRTPVRPVLTIDTLRSRELLIGHRWRENIPCELEILPGAVTDMFGLSNADTIRRNLQGDALKNYGNLLLTVTGLDTTRQYVVQLLGKDDNPVEEFTARGLEQVNREFRYLPSGQYSLRVITDYNGNGRWDTGNYDARQQPEPIYLRPLENLRANWDLEAEVRFGEQVIAEPPQNTSEQKRF